MKILQINKYPSLKGGTEKVLFDTIRLLIDEGHDVVLFSTDEGDLSYAPTYSVPYPQKESSFWRKLKNITSFFYNKQAARALEELIKKEKPDIAHVHLYLNGLSTSILPILKNNNIPIVMTLHEYRQICPSYLLMDRNNNVCEKCINGKYYNCVLSRCSKGRFPESLMLTLEMYYRRAFYKTENYVDKFICVSQFVFNKYKEFNKSILDKSIVLYNSVNQHYEAILEEKEDYFLYYGRLSEEKGISTLISAMEQLPLLHLKIVGKGDCVYNNVPPNIEMIGFKLGEELIHLIKKAKFVIVPSECFETFGLACVESLALGTPVIASDIGALPEIIEHGKNGFLFTPKDVTALKSMIEMAASLDEAKYNNLCLSARERATQFSEEKHIRGLLKIYNELIRK